MADDVTYQSEYPATPPANTVIATDDVSGVQYQVVKLDAGGDGASAPVNAVTPLPVAIQAADSGSIDAFARLRTSDPVTVFDSKQTNDNQPLFWDDAEVSGGSTTTAYSAAEAASTIGVGGIAGKRVRQTFRRFNYQPGKSQLIFVTFGEFDTATGITKEVGYFDDDNGLFFRSDAGTVSVVRKTNVTGSAVDNAVAQSSWNIDPLDGTGNSGITLDFTKTQIGIIDFEWLGVGRVRMGFVIDGLIYYCHEFLNTNNLAVVYMSTPNLPLRYSIENGGTGAADEFVHICASVISEGGQEDTGILRHKKSGAVSGLSAGTAYALVGIHLKAAYLDVSVLMERISLIATTANDQADWSLYFNPTVAGTFTYADETNSAVQTATGSSTNTITGGTLIDGGFFSTAEPSAASLSNALIMGADIDGVVDEIVLGVTPITNNITVHGGITWRELS